MDDEDFLDTLAEGDEAPAPAPAPEPETAPVEPAQEPEPPAQAEPAPEPAPEPVAPVETPPEPQHVPLGSLLDERDRRKAAEERLRRIEQAQAQAQPQQAPDMFENPDEYNAFLSQQVDARLYGERLFMSEKLAKIEHGAESFTKAKEWGLAKCDSDPFFNAKVRQSQDPYGVVMDEWKREQSASIPTDEFEQFKAWKAAQTQLSAQSPPAPPGTPASAPTNIPPRSLASAPSAGSALTEPEQSDEEMFSETFTRK